MSTKATTITLHQKPLPINPSDPPRTPDALYDFLSRTLNLNIVRTPTLAHHAAPFDYLVHAFFEGTMGKYAGPNNADCVVWANRGGGKTFLGAVATLLDLIFKPTIHVAILAGSREQSSRMFEHLRHLVSLPQVQALGTIKVTKSLITFENGSRCQILAASQTAIRGLHAQKIRCDEVDLFKRANWEAVQLATAPAPITGPWGNTCRAAIEAISTMHIPHGLMWDLALKNPGGHAGAPADTETPSPHPFPRRRPVFRWGLLDILQPCEPERQCDTCPLHPECQGQLKLRDQSSSCHGQLAARVPPRTDTTFHVDSPSSPPEGRTTVAGGRGGAAQLGEAERSKPPVSNSESVLESSVSPRPPEGGPLPAPLDQRLSSTPSSTSATSVSHSAPSADLPRLPGHLPIDAAITMKSRVSRSTWESEMLCMKPRRDNTVYPEFDPARHVIDDAQIAREDNSPIGPITALIAGIDYGYRDEGVVLLAGMDAAGRVAVLREHAREQVRVCDHAQILADWLKDDLPGVPRGMHLSYVGADPAGNAVDQHTGESSKAVLERYHLPVRTRGGDNHQGIDLIRSYFDPAWNGGDPNAPPGTPQSPRLYIHRSCTRLIECLHRYRYPDNDKHTRSPLKTEGTDHAPDALRYMLINLTEKGRITCFHY